MPKPSRVLIIGAGLAGPAMALALAKQQIRSVVFERQANPQTIGGVLMLAPNAMNVLEKIIGLEAELRPLGHTTLGIEFQATSGKEKLELVGRFGETDSKFIDGITIKRPVLHAKLLELCQRDKEFVEVRFGKKLSGIEERSDGVKAILEDGTSDEGDILLGIDGIRSRVKEHVMGGPDQAAKYQPTYSGHVVLGSVIETSKLDMTNIHPPTFFNTQAGTILCFPTDTKAETLQWAAFLEAPERARHEWNEYRTSGRAVKELQEQWKDVTAEPLRTMLASMTSENTMLWAPYATPDLPTWHTDRVCLVGDAAHAISPSAGQGTAQALEDVGLLTRLLSSPEALAKGYPALFGHYTKMRRRRLDEVRAFSERSLASRAPTPSWFRWYLKKMGMKVVLGGMGIMGRFITLQSSTFTYDVTKESIEIE